MPARRAHRVARAGVERSGPERVQPIGLRLGEEECGLLGGPDAVTDLSGSKGRPLFLGVSMRGERASFPASTASLNAIVRMTSSS
jgi:hypothetical protein